MSFFRVVKSLTPPFLSGVLSCWLPANSGDNTHCDTSKETDSGTKQSSVKDEVRVQWENLSGDHDDSDEGEEEAEDDGEDACGDDVVAHDFLPCWLVCY
jgi:hypothetical protein